MKLNHNLFSKQGLTDFFKQYKFVLAVIAAGVILLAIPSGENRDSAKETEGISGLEEDFTLEAMEKKISDILSRVEGAGEVSVMLTVRSGMERILATDVTDTQSEREAKQVREVLILSGDDGDEVVLIGQNYPTFQGALVVCPGGDDPQVRLQITQALSALTGLGAGRITVCKGS